MLKLSYKNWKLLPICFGWMVVVGYLANSFSYSAGDFLAFYEGSKTLGTHLNPYQIDTSVGPFLNGPIISLMFKPLTFLTLDQAAKFWRVISIIFQILSLALLLGILKKFELKTFLYLLPTLLLAFPSRSNLGNNQIVAFQLVLFLFVVRKSTTHISWQESFLIYIAFEVKPYLMIIPLAYLFFSVDKKVLLKISTYVALENAIFLTFWKFSWLDWLNSLFSRGHDIGDGERISSLWSVVRWLSASQIITIYLFIFVLIFILINFFLISLEIKFKLLLSMLASLLISPFSHQQDFQIASLIFFAVLISKRQRKRPNLLGLICGTWVNPGGNLLENITILLSALTILVYLDELGYFEPTKYRIKILVGIFFTFLSENLLFHLLGNSSQNLMALIFGFLVYWICLDDDCEKKLSHPTRKSLDIFRKVKKG